jgi:ribosomal protein S18 acetylase RimI-like enzyme
MMSVSHELTTNNPMDVTYRLADEEDLPALVDIENQCFSIDRLSRRSFRRWLKAAHGILVVAEINHQAEPSIIAYGLVWCHKGTRLARLYSLAVLDAYRGQSLGARLLQVLEHIAAERGKLYLRLEVAKKNIAAMRLYEQNGYRIFGEYSDYYEDHSDALRMQKCIYSVTSEKVQRITPWYQQTTEFTCGPAALMMAMASLDKTTEVSQQVEVDLWREATTVFMTSGHGGCHPLGLALAAKRRGFMVSTYINTDQVLFLDGVRSAKKREIMTLVHQQFVEQAQHHNVNIIYQSITQAEIYDYLQGGAAVLVLISTYRLDGKKAPHWVTVTAMDEHCLYVHDPDLEEKVQIAIDCQHLPIAREDFEKMTSFGSGRLNAAVILQQKK